MRWFSHRRRTGGGPRPRGPLPNKMPHKDRAPEDDSWTKCHTFSFFLPPVTLTLELGWNFCTVHLTAEFHHPMFNSSEVIMLTNWETNRRHWKHPPRSAMLCRWVKAADNTQGRQRTHQLTSCCENWTETAVQKQMWPPITKSVLTSNFHILWNYIFLLGHWILFLMLQKFLEYLQ